MGLQSKSYYDDETNPKPKSIHHPIEAWTNLLSQAVPKLDIGDEVASFLVPTTNGDIHIEEATIF